MAVWRIVLCVGAVAAVSERTTNRCRCVEQHLAGVAAVSDGACVEAATNRSGADPTYEGTTTDMLTRPARRRMRQPRSRGGAKSV